MLRHSLSTSGTISGNWAPSLICTQPPCARGGAVDIVSYTLRCSYEDFSRYGLPSGVDLPPHQDQSFLTNGRFICNRAIRTRAQCWYGQPMRPHHFIGLPRETLLQWISVMKDCLSLLSLPLSLQLPAPGRERTLESSAHTDLQNRAVLHGQRSHQVEQKLDREEGAKV